MRQVLVALLLACTLFVSTPSVRGNQPPPPKTLPERVESASHVIIGTAKKVVVVELKDGKLQEVNPQPSQLERGQAALVEIEVEEVMYPLGWKPKQAVRYLFGGGFFEVAEIRKDTLGKKLIYLMSPNPFEELKQEANIFFPSYEWHLAQSLQQKAEIQAVLEARVKREAEAKAKQQQPKR